MSEDKNVVETHGDLPKNAEVGERFTVKEDAIVYEYQKDGTWKDVDIDEVIDAENDQAQTSDNQATPADNAEKATDENQQVADEGNSDDNNQSTASDNAQQGPASDTPADEDDTKVDQQQTANGGERPIDVQTQTDNQNPSTDSAKAVETAEQQEEAKQADPDQELPSDDEQKNLENGETTPRQESAVNEVSDEKQQDGVTPPTAPAAPPVEERPRAEVNPETPQSTPEAKPDEVKVAAAQQQALNEDNARDQIDEAGSDANPATTAESTPAGEQKADEEARQQAAADDADKPAEATETQHPNSGVADDVNVGKPRNDQTYIGDQNAANTPSPATVQHQENHTAEENPVVSQEETAVQNATDPDAPTIIPAEATSESMNHSPANPTQETVYVKQDENVDPEVKVIRQRIEEYIAQMGRNGTHRRNEGPKLQARLYKTLHAVMALEPIKFKQAMDYLLDRVYEERAGAFSDVYVRRYFDMLSPEHLQTNQVKEFDNVLSLVTNVGYSKNRSRALKDVDLQRALKNIQDAGKQQRMAAYFSALR